MSRSADYATLVLQCHCQSCKIKAFVPTSTLPLAISMCHCTTCRLVTGQLCATVATLPPGSEHLEIQGVSVPKSYRATVDGLIRFFCPTCGTSLYEQSPTGQVYIDTGSIKHIRSDDGQLMLEPSEHIFVKDTKDGGLRDLMAQSPSWEGWPERSKRLEPSKLYGPTAASIEPDAPPVSEERLECHCHCKGVRFSISRPNEKSREAVMKQHLDLLVPWYEDEDKRSNSTNEPFWLHGDKYLAGLCVCSDCRTASGFEVQSWAFVPVVNIEMTSKSTLVRYASSKHGIYREFCWNCSATVFYGHDQCEGARECLDVSVGLMQSSSGARANNWLEWHTGRVSYEEKADNAPFAEALCKGARC